jgi:hypothetical protein
MSFDNQYIIVIASSGFALLRVKDGNGHANNFAILH